MYGSDGPAGDSGGPGGGSGGPGGGSETVFGTDVRNRQCLEQSSEPTQTEPLSFVADQERAIRQVVSGCERTFPGGCYAS